MSCKERLGLESVWNKVTRSTKTCETEGAIQQGKW
jgi:hypothetical protein